jgi:hypothetical protein
LVNGLIFANRFPAARCVLYILQAICRVTSDVFRSEFHLRLNKARRASSLYEQLPYAEQAKLLRNEDLDPVTILLESTTTYKNMVDEGYWPPAKNPVDKSSAPEISTMSMPSSLQQMTRQQLDALVQSGGCPQLNALIQSNIDKTKHAIKKDHTCFNCGEAGHFSRDCPKPKQNNNNNNSRTLSPWRTTAPASNASFIKDIKGTKWYWCATCSKWTKSHVAVADSTKAPGVATHNGGRRGGGNNQNNNSTTTPTPEANLVQTDGIPLFY